MPLIIHFDGACEPKNPGGVGTYGFLILDEKGNTIHEGYGIACEPGPGCTNNIAEYTGLVKALEWLVGNGYSGSRIIIRGDSQLVIRQLLGEYGVYSSRLKLLYERALELLGNFNAELEWVPREENARADELSKRAYIEYLDRHPELVNALKPYLATERQVRLLKRLGVEPRRYLSKAEASRLISRLLGSR